MKHSGLRSDLDTSAEHMWSITVKFSAFYFKSTDIYFQTKIFLKNLLRIQIFWIQIRTDVLVGLICVQTVMQILSTYVFTSGKRRSWKSKENAFQSPKTTFTLRDVCYNARWFWTTVRYRSRTKYS